MKKFSLIVLMIGCSLMASAALSLKTAAGWQESAYMEFTGLNDSYAFYNAYVSEDGGSNWTKLDGMLVRSYGTYGRVDAVGLKAGSNYKLKVVPTAKADSTEITADAVTSGALTVINYDRSGFAHTGKYTTTGVGAYNNDGTLKSNAVVLYVSAATAKTVQMTVTGATTNPCVGLQSIITGYEKGQETRPLCVRFIGEVKELDRFGSKEEGLQIKGRKENSELNITVEGIGNDAMLRFGFLIRNAASLELRNLGIATTLDDDVSLDSDNDHIWIHNLDVFYGPNGSGDHAKGDGAIDLKDDSKHVTISYCHFWDTGKSAMCGMKSETGPNYITYHHNWFDHSDSRHARIRTMSVHMYNNYFDGIAKYGVGACMGSSVFMEANYFRNCPKPMLISKQGTDIHMGEGSSDETKGTFSGEEGGIIKSFGNYHVGSKTLVTYQQNSTHFDCWEASTRAAKVPADVKSLLGSHTYDNFDTNASVMYVYTPDKAEDVPSIVTGEKGAGRIQHGDFKFTFTNADDALYEVNSDLRKAIDQYETSLVDFIGEGGVASACPEGTKGEGEEKEEGEGGGGGGTITGGSFECHFTGKKPSSTFYTINGSYSNSKGKATVNGTEYTDCLKIESSTSITFTLEAENTIYLHFADSETSAKITIDDKVLTATNAVITQDLAAGAHKIAKADGAPNLFYINMLKEPATGIYDSMNEVKATKFFHNGQLLIIRDGVTYDMMGRVVE